MTSYFPDISCVVIGINCERTLSYCLESIQKLNYSKPLEIIYVDGGSTDKSILISKNFQGLNVIELNLKNSKPGKGRNVGWKTSKGEWVHFFDSDTVVNQDWLLEAVKHINSGVGAIFGWRKELYPNRNWFHFVADLEWTRPSNESKFFGGDVLIRHSVLEETSGYDESLTAGEDPELSARIRQRGWKIIGVNSAMCYHDINMNNVTQYFQRSFRTGYGYVEAGIKMLKDDEKEWLLKTTKIFFKEILIIFLVIFGIFSRFHICWLIAVAAFFSPLRKVKDFRKEFGITFREALVYAFHCSVVSWLQFYGILQFCFKKYLKFSFFKLAKVHK